MQIRKLPKSKHHPKTGLYKGNGNPVDVMVINDGKDCFMFFCLFKLITMKSLTICYSTFNGLELLEKSIENIHDLVDYIIVCNQTTSNTGNLEQNPYENLQTLRRLEKKYDNVAILYYMTDLNLNTKENERKKHDLMIQKAKLTGCSHFMFSACDHFYERIEFIRGKAFCFQNDYDVTFTKMYTYYKQLNWQISPIEDYYFPFIMKMHKNTEISQMNYPVLVDPSIKVNTSQNFHIFSEQKIMMHHFSMIRVDIVDKFTNAAASLRWNPKQILTFIDEYENAKPGNEITYFKNKKIIEVKNNKLLNEFGLI